MLYQPDLIDYIYSYLQLKYFVTKKTFFFLLIASVVSFASCGSGSSKQNTASDSAQTPSAPQPTATTAPVAYDASLATGKVTDSVICKAASDQSYALYLPSYYTPGKPFPCIYFFDAHARGALPVNAYKGLAEKYGFILIGSNISKNNTPWKNTNDVINTLFNDTHERINIDPKRIYTSGFSGGARVASAIAILNGGVAGVIACAAGFPKLNQNIKYKCDFFGIVGASDFNYTEMEQLNDQLDQGGFTHEILVSEGSHDWPSTTDFRTALMWLQVNAMKENLQAKDDSIAHDLQKDYDKRIATARAHKDWLDLYSLCSNAMTALGGLSDVATYKAQLNELAGKADYTNAVSEQSQLLQEESAQQQQIVGSFASMTQQQRVQKVKDLNHSINSAKTILASQMYKRLLNFYGLICYLNSTRALGAGDLAGAANYLNTFRMADPKNPDCDYLEAVYNMEKQDARQALVCLGKAATRGYSDIPQLTADPAFSSLHSDPAFQRVVTKVVQNARQLRE